MTINVRANVACRMNKHFSQFLGGHGGGHGGYSGGGHGGYSGGGHGGGHSAPVKVIKVSSEIYLFLFIEKNSFRIFMHFKISRM